MNCLVAYYLVDADGTTRRIARSYITIHPGSLTRSRLEQLERDLCDAHQCAGVVIINVIHLYKSK